MSALTPRPVFRFAPSPNGPLHLGHALSALLNHDLALAEGGRLRVRIDDIDASRARPAFEAQILDDLAFLGCRWEEPVRRQSEHRGDYRAAIDRLAAMGLVKESFATRREIAGAAKAAEAAGRPFPRDPDGAVRLRGDDGVLSPEEVAARRAAGVPPARRLDMAAALARLEGPLHWSERDPEAAGARPVRVAGDPARWGDVVLARKDGTASYNLSVVVDDAAEAITDVVRGRDLYEATAVHRLLQALLGLPAPCYRHHRLILDREGRKLSKSEGAASLAALRADGASADDIRRLVGLRPA